MLLLTNPDKTKFSAKVIKKAVDSLRLMAKGELKCKKIIYHKRKNAFDMYKIDIGAHYRLISFDLINWQLMSHESYNRFFLR